jgi:hypothetical protein
MMTLVRSGRDLVLVLVGRVVVRRLGLELGGAGVDGLEGRPHPGGEAGGAHLGLVDAPQVGELGVGEPEPLGPPPARRGHAVEADLGQVGRSSVIIEHLVEEPRVDLGGLVHRVDG